jgi:3-oxoacyl-[acyl-carrier-protein] synthase III
LERVGLAITGCGAAAPARSVSNEEVCLFVDTSDEWIATRTGIRNRHLASPEDSLAQLGATAAFQALEMAGISPQEVDLILLATSTPDDLFGTAGVIQSAIGAPQAVAFDLTAACSGFVFGLVTAAQYIRTGTFKNIVLIGGDILSRWVNWDDRRTCVLFGDGAGAVVLQAREGDDGLLGFQLRSDGTQNSCLNINPKLEAHEISEDLTIAHGHFNPITMNGQEVYKFAVRKVPEIIEKNLFHSNLTAADIDWLIMHQANQRILDAVADRLKISHDKVVSNLATYGNTSAASIPLALNEAVRDGRIQPGQTLVMAGFGAGLSWGSAIVKWC